MQVLDKLREIWQQEWGGYSEARHSKLFIDMPSKTQGKKVCALNRVDLHRLFLAITNHNYLRYHLALQDDTINPTCRFRRLYDETFDDFFLCTILSFPETYFTGFLANSKVQCLEIGRDHGLY